MCAWERKGERERKRETERQRERWREGERERERWREREKERGREREILFTSVLRHATIHILYPLLPVVAVAVVVVIVSFFLVVVVVVAVVVVFLLFLFLRLCMGVVWDIWRGYGRVWGAPGMLFRSCAPAPGI